MLDIIREEALEEGKGFWAVETCKGPGLELGGQEPTLGRIRLCGVAEAEMAGQGVRVVRLEGEGTSDPEHYPSSFLYK